MGLIPNGVNTSPAPREVEKRPSMLTRVRKLHRTYRQQGSGAALEQISRYLRNLRNRGKYKEFVGGLKDRDAATIFTEIYHKKLWPSGESRSGFGSELAYTENVRRNLPVLFERFGIQTVVDLPCGDFNWMQLVNLRPGMSYIGIDIVPQLIESNESLYGNEQRHFLVGNILKDPLPVGDLLICRDCLFHFSTADILRALRNFVSSNIHFLLTSTHLRRGQPVNAEINTGEFRQLDLFSPPFCLSPEVFYRFDDYIEPFPPREMCLWTREQVRSALQKCIPSTEA